MIFKAFLLIYSTQCGGCVSCGVEDGIHVLRVSESRSVCGHSFAGGLTV